MVKDRELEDMLTRLIAAGSAQGFETANIPCDLKRLGVLIEESARLRREIIERVEKRLAEAIEAGTMRATQYHQKGAVNE